MEDIGELLTPRQVAAKLQVSVGTVLRLLRNSRLKGVKLGRHWRVRPADLETYLEGAAAGTGGAPIGDALAAVDPIVDAKPMGLPIGWKLVGTGVLTLLLVQVSLLSALVVMALGWRSSGAESGDSREPHPIASSLDERDSGTPRGALSSPPNPVGLKAETAPEKVVRNSGSSNPSPSPTAASPVPSLSSPGMAVPQPASLVIGNTGGEGANIRLTPGGSDRVRAWPEGVTMVVVGGDRQAEGRIWKNVMDPEGTKGWIAADYLVYHPVPTLQPAPPVTYSPSGTALDKKRTDRKDR